MGEGIQEILEEIKEEVVEEIKEHVEPVVEISAAEIALAQRKLMVEANPELYAEQTVSAVEIAEKERSLKETKEFVVGAIALAKAFSAEMGDGFQSSDLINLARKIAVDAAFRDSLWEAAKGAQLIPQEVKEANAAEIALELGQAILDSLKK